MRLDLGGIGVGYAVDEALAVLKRHGIRSAMIDASGDIGVLDCAARQGGLADWSISRPDDWRTDAVCLPRERGACRLGRFTTKTSRSMAFDIRTSSIRARAWD